MNNLLFFNKNIMGISRIRVNKTDKVFLSILVEIKLTILPHSITSHS